MSLIRIISITQPDQIPFHLENGEYVTYSIYNEDADGYLKKTNDGYKVVVHQKWDNGYFVSDDVEDVSNVVRNLFRLNATMTVYPGFVVGMAPDGRFKKLINFLMKRLFRTPDMLPELFAK